MLDKPMKKVFCLVCMVIACLLAGITVSAETIGVIGDDVKAYTGSGSSDDPLRYLFDINSKVTWKHLCDVRDQGVTEVYEKREGNTEDGNLLYSWTFSGEDITTPEGPYFLAINFYSGDALKDLPGGSEAMYFSFACKRDLPGPALISLYVGDCFEDGTKLELYYYGGYDSAMVHGSAPIIDSNEISETGERKNIAAKLPVWNGYTQFAIRYGGNYFLTEALEADKEASAVEDSSSKGDSRETGSGKSDKVTPESGIPDKNMSEIDAPEKNTLEKAASRKAVPSKDPSDGKGTAGETAGDNIEWEETTNSGMDGEEETAELMQGDKEEAALYQEEAVLGRIDEVFRTEAVALAIADSLSKNITDEISQADINGIKRLYLSGKGLDSMEDLGAVEFERLESLELSDNKISSIPALNMPMLSYIDLSKNCIADASALTQLQGLEVILLQDNQLTKLPQINMLPKLKALNAENNLIDRLILPESSSLVYLNLGNNRITEISGLKGLASLEYIDISGNYMKELPDFTACGKLTEILSDQNSEEEENKAVYLIPAIVIGGSILLAVVYVLRRTKACQH